MYKTYIKRMLPKSVIEVLKFAFDLYSIKSYSQDGEDIILRRIFNGRSIGFYVDVGAHHPMRFSNTYFFYKKGWHGINIDAMPGSMHLFNVYRPRDINLEVPISAESKVLTYYVFNEPALNGFDADLSNSRISEDNQYHIVDTIELRTKRLDSILDKYISDSLHIDFLSIDVEGLDFEVLKSNNWIKYKPEVILVEVLGSTLAELADSDITKFLKSHGYSIYAKAVNTVIYTRHLST